MKPQTAPPRPAPRVALNAWFLDQPTTGSGQYLAHLLDEFQHSRALGGILLCGRAGQAPPPGPFEWQVLRTPFDAPTVEQAGSRLRRHLAKLWFEQISVVRASRRWDADLLHVPYWAGPLYPRVPTVVTIHDLIPAVLPAYSGGRLGKLYTGLVSRSARRAARVLTDSHASRQDILERLHLEPERVETIYLAASAEFAPVRDQGVVDEVRVKYGLPPRYLLYLGGFDARKNVTAILRAYSRLEMEDVALVIAGRLPARTSEVILDPRPLAAELGIVGRVRFCGWVDERDKPAIYSGALAYVFPSTYEGFGLPPLEAMSCGTPVIVSDRASLPEIVGDGGLYVAPDDVDALAQAMHRLATDAGQRQALAQAALAQATRFRWTDCAQATLDAYRRVLASNRHRTIGESL
jgi:glycosyltransferase involved in cell wall biosynthesis